MTHNAQVLGHLKKGKPITPLEAWKMFGCYRLGARIYDLKKAGHDIRKRMIEVDTEKGDIARVAQYWLAPEAVKHG